jgi:hypothetical protein
VLEGSLRRQGDTIRVTTQLIDAATSLHVWSKTYDRKLGDILALQEEIARAVAGSLEAGLVDAQGEPDIDPRAYVLFLDGRYFNMRGAADSIEVLPEGVERSQLLALNRYGQGLPAESDTALAQLTAGVRMPWGARHVAEVHAFRGDGASAMHWLSGIGWGPDCRDLRLAQSVYYSPFLAKLEGMPDWDEYRSDLLRFMRSCTYGLEIDKNPA